MLARRVGGGSGIIDGRMAAMHGRHGEFPVFHETLEHRSWLRRELSLLIEPNMITQRNRKQYVGVSCPGPSDHILSEGPYASGIITPL